MKYMIVLLAALLIAVPLGCDEEKDDGCECALDDAECTENGESLRICSDSCKWVILSCDYLCVEGGKQRGTEDYSIGCYYDSEVEHDSCLCETWEF